MKNFNKYKIYSDKLPKILFIFSLFTIIFCYGFATHQYHIFPYTFLREAREGMYFILSWARGDRGAYYSKTDHKIKIPVYKKDVAYNGPSLITSVAENDSLSVKIIDMDGTLIHGWKIDWFEIWPDATHLSQEEIPKSRPGTQIHGAVLLDNGDLVFNFEHLGLVRLDVCGRVVWKLPYRTHHSIYKDEYDNLWISAQKNHTEPLPDFPNYKPLFIEPIVLKVSLEGEILNEISIMTLLKKNNLQGLLFMSSIDNMHTLVSGDTLHLNDVETFPSFMKEGFFKAGDIMVSLRNINTILIFREEDLKIKYLSIGEFVRQHDPDFIDGNTISVFDNNNIASGEDNNRSMIVIKSLIDDQSQVYYSGDEERMFYTRIMGKHQKLPNGNMLITESQKARAFEIDKRGQIVWEYINIVEEGYVGALEEVERLPNKFTKKFFDRKVQECLNSKQK